MTERPAESSSGAALEDLDAPGADELLVVVGPTASGKTELALRLCERFDAEVVGADSVQVYRHFDIGSGKPNDAELARARHHLVGVADPLEPMDAARYAQLADEAIAGIRARDRQVVVCGGTFLWVKALLFGLAPGPPADPAIRAEHERIAATHGREALHARLAKVDPISAERLAPNDLLRVSRALEVHQLSGKPLSAWHAAHEFREARYRARMLGVARPRTELDERIRQRTRGWLEGGWIDEVRRLLDMGFADARAMASVGYRQVREHLAGELEASELEDAIVRSTRKFVRRQRTWLRDQPVTWLAP
jgi:tRNA dimethylallyltransferase